MENLKRGPPWRLSPLVQERERREAFLKLTSFFFWACAVHSSIGRMSFSSWAHFFPLSIVCTHIAHCELNWERERHSLNVLLCSFELVPCTLRVAECHSLLERTSFLCPLLCVLTMRTANYIRFLSARLSFVHSVYSPCAWLIVSEPTLMMLLVTFWCVSEYGSLYSSVIRKMAWCLLTLRSSWPHTWISFVHSAIVH